MLVNIKGLFSSGNKVASTPRTQEKSHEPADKVTLNDSPFPEKEFKHYKLGKSLAETYLDASKHTYPSQCEERSSILEQGLNTILSNPKTTKEEKLLAKLGLDINKELIATTDPKDYHSYSEYVGGIFMGAIGSSISGPTGAVLASIYSDLSESIRPDKSLYMLDKGFNVILSNPGVTEEDSTQANLAMEKGKEFKDKGELDNAYRIEMAFMKSIAENGNVEIK